MGLVKVRKTVDKREWEWKCTRCEERDWAFKHVEFANWSANDHALTHMRDVLRELAAMK